MGIREVRGSLLAADVEALVNTVNTVGVMGKGIALQFKQAFPANFKAYNVACKAGNVRLGEMFVHDQGVLGKPRWIINFPTKGHWRSNSHLQDIDSGLANLVRVIRELEIKSVAVPALGCGNGGLDWAVVRPRILAALGDLEGLDVALYPPAGAPAAHEMPVRTERPKMTLGKAVLLAITARYYKAAAATRTVIDPLGASLLEMQKLMYLMQEAGQPLRLRFEKGRYGPYAENLNMVLQAIEGHYTRGYGDRSDAVLRLAPIKLLEGAAETADEFLAHKPEVQDRLGRVMRLVDGFESPYGLELLATVHYAGTHIAKDGSSIVATVQAWNERKKNLFAPEHIEVALDQLTAQGWLPSPVR
jgi:O-acetyl-ADP-ribose deacetylase (regulator of RNase III)